MAQFETPIAATEAILKQARAAGARTILNLAPFVPHADRLMKVVDVAVLNEIELSQATGAKLRAASAVRDVVAACEKLRAQGRARRRGDPGRPRRRRGDGRRRDRHPRLQGQGRRHDRRGRLLRGCAGGADVGRRHARRGGALRQRRGRLFRRAAGRGALDADGRRKLRRGWRGPKSRKWSKNSSGRTPISRRPRPPLPRSRSAACGWTAPSSIRPAAVSPAIPAPLRWDGGEAAIVDAVKADGADVLHVLAPDAPRPAVGTKVHTSSTGTAG